MATAMSRPVPNPPFLAGGSAAGRTVVGLAMLASISVEAEGEGSAAGGASAADFGCGGRWPWRTAEMALVNSLPSAKRVPGSLRRARLISSRVGALIDVDKGSGA